MSLTSLLTETIRRHRYPVVDDEYGNPVLDYTNPSTVTLRGRLEQTSASEEIVDRDTRISDWRIFLHPTADVAALDRIQDADGRLFDVVGTPQPQRAPRGLHHLQVQLRLVEGA